VSESTEGAPPAAARQRALRTLAHDLGNLAYRLTFLAENLRHQIPDPGHRDEAVALLEDTVSRMRATIASLREEADHV